MKLISSQRGSDNSHRGHANRNMVVHILTHTKRTRPATTLRSTMLRILTGERRLEASGMRWTQQNGGGCQQQVTHLHLHTGGIRGQRGRARGRGGKVGNTINSRSAGFIITTNSCKTNELNIITSSQADRQSSLQLVGLKPICYLYQNL